MGARIMHFFLEEISESKRLIVIAILKIFYYVPTLPPHHIFNSVIRHVIDEIF